MLAYAQVANAIGQISFAFYVYDLTVLCYQLQHFDQFNELLPSGL